MLMRTIRAQFLAGLTAVILASVQAADTEVAKEDLAKLQGEWSMVSGSADGQPMPENMLKEMKRTCHGDEATTTMSGQVIIKARISLDPSRNPKTINYQMTGGFTQGKKQLGIYEVNGDMFRSCFGKPGAERPTDFTSRPGDGRTLSVWRRDKPAAPAPEKK